LDELENFYKNIANPGCVSDNAGKILEMFNKILYFYEIIVITV